MNRSLGELIRVHLDRSQKPPRPTLMGQLCGKVVVIAVRNQPGAVVRIRAISGSRRVPRNLVTSRDALGVTRTSTKHWTRVGSP